MTPIFIAAVVLAALSGVATVAWLLLLATRRRRLPSGCESKPQSLACIIT